MKTTNFEESQNQDKTEVVKQQEENYQKVFEKRLTPHKNHILFEISLANGTIEKAVFDTLPELKWEEAKKGIISVNKKITQKENCIYIPALNKKNALKILDRDFGLKFKTNPIK